jgi:hypothetical protein
MYRTIYNKDSGKIIISRKISDEMLATRLATYTHQASIDGYTDDIQNKKVDLNTLTVVDDVQEEDVVAWMRERRRLLLAECDWTVGADSPLSDSKKTEWQTYRQALRDLPATYPDVTDRNQINFPTKPE